MKRVIFIIFALFMIFINYSVNASTITYNLNIDQDLILHENIVYEIEKDKVINDGNYYFLTSIVNDPVYFDVNRKVEYKKEKTTTDTGYRVVLTNDFSSIFLNTERIVKECFESVDISRTASSLKFSTPNSFYCSHRADKIVVNITTGLNVVSSNADVVNNNTYTWNNIDKNFSLSMNVEPAKIEHDPLDGYQKSENNTQQDINENQNNEKQNSKSVLKYIIIAIPVLLILILVALLILKRKQDNLNKL